MKKCVERVPVDCRVIAVALGVVLVLMLGCSSGKGPTSTLNPPPPGITWTRPADEMVMVYVMGGEFQMGIDDDDVDYIMALCRTDCKREWFEKEQPIHTVALDGFWIDQTEVTNAQYQRCVEARICRSPTFCDWGEPTYRDASKADHPVICVDWHEAQAYCGWAGARLPTEAEWEYAARGPEGNIYPWGDTFDGSRLNFFCDANCTKSTDYDDGYEMTAPVGSFPNGASWCGARDMAGNVWEWTNDWDDSGYYSVSPDKNPPGPESGVFKVRRGGSWYFDDEDDLFTASRGNAAPTRKYSYIGFRCVVVAPGQ